VAEQHFAEGHRPVGPGKTGIGAKRCFRLGNDLVRQRRVVRFRFEQDQARFGIMRVGLVRIEQKSLVSPLHRPRVQVHTLVAPTESIVRRVDVSGAGESIGVGWVESQRILEQV
jgi:hypothetical protein